MNPTDDLQAPNLDPMAMSRMDRHTPIVRRAKRLPLGLNGRHRMMMRLSIMGQGPTQIARTLGMSPSHVSIVMNSPLFKQELSKMHAEVDQRTVYDAADELMKLQEDAVVALADTVRQTQYPTLRFHAARDILNRTGARVPAEVHVTKDQTTYEERLMQVQLKYSPDPGGGYTDSSQDIQVVEPPKIEDDN